LVSVSKGEIEINTIFEGTVKAITVRADLEGDLQSGEGLGW